VVICLERGADGPADDSAIPKLHIFLPHLNPDWFYLSGTHDQEKRLLNGVVIVVVVPMVIMGLAGLSTKHLGLL